MFAPEPIEMLKWTAPTRRGVGERSLPTASRFLKSSPEGGSYTEPSLARGKLRDSSFTVAAFVIRRAPACFLRLSPPHPLPLSVFLLSGTRRCSRLILSFSLLLPWNESLLLRSPGFFYWRTMLRLKKKHTTVFLVTAYNTLNMSIFWPSNVWRFFYTSSNSFFFFF